jgi:hypothetical protein
LIYAPKPLKIIFYRFTIASTILKQIVENAKKGKKWQIQFTDAMTSHPLSLAANATPPKEGTAALQKTLDKVQRKMAELNQQIQSTIATITTKQNELTALRDRVNQLLIDKDKKLDDISKGVTASTLFGAVSFLGTGGLGSVVSFGGLTASGPIGWTVLGLGGLTALCGYSTKTLWSQIETLGKFSMLDVNKIIDSESLDFTQNQIIEDAIVQELTGSVRDANDAYLVRLNGDLDQRSRMVRRNQLIFEAVQRTFNALELYERNLSDAIRNSGFYYLLPKIITGAQNAANQNPAIPAIHPHAQ